MTFYNKVTGIEYKNKNTEYNLDKYTKNLEYNEKIINNLKNTNIVHWGQLKLLISEIELFNKKNVLNKEYQNVIIYIGAANGFHIQLLTEFYPNNIWILVDPGIFSKFLISNAKYIESKNIYFNENNMDIIILNRIFEDNKNEKKYLQKLLQKIYGKNKKYGNLIFISDIRHDNKMENILQDMILQEKWLDMLKPDYSLLKFRLPYTGLYKYFKGTIYKQAFSKIGSAETRLFVKLLKKKSDIYTYKTLFKKNKGKFEMIKYDCEKYEKSLFYFNIQKRNIQYSNNNIFDNQFIIFNNKKIFIKNIIDNCFDCLKFLKVVSKFDKQNIIKNIAHILQTIDYNYIKFDTQIFDKHIFPKDILSKILKLKSFGITKILKHNI